MRDQPAYTANKTTAAGIIDVSANDAL